MLTVVRDLPNGWTWDRRWQTLARLMSDGEILGEASLNNGKWTGTIGGREVMTSASLDTATALETVMGQVEEVARRME